MSLSNDNRWRETADAATRAQYPDEYWCVADDGWVQYLWAEQTVTREEYLANSGNPIAKKKPRRSEGQGEVHLMI